MTPSASPPSLLDCGRGLGTRQDVRSDDVGALARQGEAVRLSDPTRRPRDNGHSIFESHVLLPQESHTGLTVVSIRVHVTTPGSSCQARQVRWRQPHQRFYPKPALHLVLYYFIKLNNHAIWVKRKSTAQFPGGRLEQRVRWYDKLYPFALEVFVDRIKTIDPEPNVRDPYLIGLNARARG